MAAAMVDGLLAKNASLQRELICFSASGKTAVLVSEELEEAIEKLRTRIILLMPCLKATSAGHL